MKNLILILALTGCSGEAFTGFTPGDPVEADGGFDSKIAAGGQGEDDGGVLPTGTGGRGTGGSTSAGGATTVGMGGTVVATGGSTGTGGVTGTGGTIECTPVTHSNGIGQTWQDCFPLGTYNQSQALKACKASASTTCISRDWCGPGYTVLGWDVHGIFIGEWGAGAQAGGCVAVGDGLGNYNGSACDCATVPGGSTWD